MYVLGEVEAHARRVHIYVVFYFITEAGGFILLVILINNSSSVRNQFHRLRIDVAAEGVWVLGALAQHAHCYRTAAVAVDPPSAAL